MLCVCVCVACCFLELFYEFDDAIGDGPGGEVGGVGSRIGIDQFEGVAQAVGACGPRSIVAAGKFEDGRAKGIDKADIFATV